MKKIYLVYSDDCNEGDCDCYLESVDSAWTDKNKAAKRADGLYHGNVRSIDLDNDKLLEY